MLTTTRYPVNKHAPPCRPLLFRPRPPPPQPPLLPYHMDRLRQLAGQFTGNSTSGRDTLFRKSPDDVVITMAIRTPLTKAGKGGFKDTRYVYPAPFEWVL